MRRIIERTGREVGWCRPVAGSSRFPPLSRFPDIASDAVYQPNEIDPLLTELLRAQDRVRKSKSIRGIDNLIRIARWAAKLKVGIYFGGQ